MIRGIIKVVLRGVLELLMKEKLAKQNDRADFISDFGDLIVAIEYSGFYDKSDIEDMADHFRQLETLVELGVVIAARDSDGEIRYYHADHIGVFVPADTPRVLLDELRIRHQTELYGDSLN